MERSKHWLIRLSIWFGVFMQGAFCFAAELPPQLKTSVPPAAWVREFDWTAPTNEIPDEKSKGSRYLLFERQDNPAEKERFTHVVQLMENATGVQDSGSLNFSFDPSFQELVLHRVEIHRNGKVLNKLNVAKIKVIQPEEGLGSDVFTGEQSVVLFVEDLRVGDVLEYAYTARGANPVLNGHYAAKIMAQSSVPVERQRLRLVWDSQKPVLVRANSIQVEAKKAPWNKGTEYQWDFIGLESIPFEDDVPFEFDPYPSLEFTDFQNWAEVVNWALPLYVVEKTNPPAELEELIAKWRGLESDEVRARAALDFVQDELRYTGIELGPDSYRPAHPFETFQLRYGDCKGKASLLCTILREMNIEAYPALVDSAGGMISGGCLPSPFAFNHAIVKIVLDGKTVWVDPTASYQGGLLWNRHVSHFGKALVIRPGVADLESIPYPAPDKPQQRVTSTFKLNDYKSPAAVTIKTVFQGKEADDNREYFARNNRQDIQKNYLNFYSRYYDGVTEVAPLTVEDNRQANALVVTEQYRIANLWTTNTAEKQYDTSFYADTLYYKLTVPDVRVRKMPLRISYPMRQEQEVIVQMPDNEWNLPNTNKDIEDEAFTFHYQRTFANATLRFYCLCETKTNQIPAASVSGYLKNRERMSNLLEMALYRSFQPRKVGGLNWLMVVIACLGLAGTVVGGCWFWWFTRPRVVAGAESNIPPLLVDAHLQGLGGWLVLVGLGLCLAPIVRIFTIARAWKGFFLMASWQAVAVPSGASYHPLYGPLLIFEVLTNVGLFGINILALALFFSKRKVFPKVYVVFLISNLICVVVDEVVNSGIQSAHAGSSANFSALAYRSVLATMLWWGYMVKSRRVKVTFVR